MIPEKLTIEGLYSYQEKTEIDFTKLMDSQLFGIFGSVGSGKSSILEAIMYVIYGQTERINMREKRNYNMMNLRSNRTEIDFIFSVADGSRYRANVIVKRRPSDFNEVTSPERNAYCKQEGEWLPCELGKLEEAIGLSYENFKRTVIIPQGKFQEFLHLTGKDRSTMLKEIFNLHKFDLAQNVGSIKKKNNDALIRVESLLEGMEEASEEEQKRLTSRSKELKEQTEKLTKELATLEKQERKWSESEKLFLEKSEKKKQLAELSKQKESIDLREKRLKEFQKASLQLGTLLKQQAANSKDQEEVQKQILSTKQKLEIKEQELNDIKPKLEKAQQDFKNLDRERRKKEDLEKQLEVIQLTADCEKLTERKKNGEIELKKKQDESEAVKKQLAEKEKALQVAKLNFQKLEAVPKVELWFGKFQSLKESIDRQEKQLEEGEQTVNRLQEQLKTVAVNWKVNFSPEKGEIEFGDKQEELESEIRKVRKQLDKLKLKNEVAHMALQLEAGDSCPVCGSTEHPEMASEEKVTEETLILKKKLNEIEKEKGELISEKSSTKEKSRQLKELKAGQKQHLAELQKLQKVVGQHREAYDWNEILPEPHEENIRELTLKSEKAKELVENSEKAVENLRKNQEQIRQDLEKFQSVFAKIENDFTVKSTELSSAKKSITNEEVRKLHSEEEIKITIQKLVTKMAETEKSFETYEKMHQDAEELLKQHQNTIKIRTEGAEKLEKDGKELTSEIESQLSKSGFESLEIVREILNREIEVEKEGEVISKFNKAFHAASERLKELEEKTKNSDFDAEKYKALKEKISGDNHELNELKDSLAAVNSQLVTIIKQLEKKKELLKEKDRLDKRAEYIKVIDNLMRGNKFVDYISSVYLHEICHAANDRFMKLTRQSLSMEIDENNAFRVRDFLNGGKVRSAKTLSGGQTFQASLSLALALADRIQQQQKAKQNFFFLDEGFGSQDKESLQVVFDSLKELRKENRAVGVISHVEELQQEIPAFIKIHNDPEKGSQVEFSF